MKAIDRDFQFHLDMIFLNEASTVIKSARKEDAIELGQVRDEEVKVLGIQKRGYINQKMVLVFIFAVDRKTSKTS